MANDPNDRFRLPGPGERIRRLAENPVPSGGIPLGGTPHERVMYDSGVPGAAQLAYADGGHGGGNLGGAHGAHGHHPTAKTYVIIGVILTLITALEVSAYYIRPWETSAIYIPSMLFLSAVKFTTVVMFYMHLKYDHKLFRALFTGPFLIAFTTLCALLFLFGKLAIRLGLLS